jgi:hypothetical protein
MKALLTNAQQGHAALLGLWAQLKPHMLAGRQYVVEVKDKTRSTEQNARMWALLSEVSAQVVWHGRKLTPEEWKHVFTASLKRQDVVPGIDGGFVVLGKSTSKMSVREMGELMELVEAFGAQQGVRFSAPEWMEVA